VRGTLADLERLAPTTGDAFLRVFVREPVRAGLADDVRALLRNAVDVRIDVPEPDAAAAESSPPRSGRSARDLFSDYLATRSIDDPRVVTLFERLHDEVLDEATV
jgi:exonuclease SbcD